ncbi:MAG: tRNA-dihydrouridine synthase [Rhizobacter sp.]|nr:tRNA-dihydrouridine synthase [Rhizobacter sp.]
MTLLLAPMEGLLDHTLRDILTRVGGIDRCVSEFIRVTGTLLPDRAFVRVVPELLNGGRTPAGVPVRAQLMGSDPACVAENAAKLAALGPAGIDLNFGCPAKVVNRHGGGAALLQDPALLHSLVSAVRRAVPAAMPVSAKMRLGFNDASRALECALALQDGGAEELVVHARTRADGYRPPAYWDRIQEIREALRIPIVANGEIWNAADAQRCRAASGCHMLMLGRGMVSDPGLALAIASPERAPVPWSELQVLMRDFWALVATHVVPRHRAGRLKQWLNYLRRRYPEAEAAYADVRTVNDPNLISAYLFASQNAAAAQPLEAEPAAA